MSGGGSGEGRGYRNAALLAANVGTIATLIPLAMKQLGGIDHLPDPPGAVFDSDAITGSKAAHPLGVPDSLPGMANFGMTLALVLGGAGRREGAAVAGGEAGAGRRVCGVQPGAAGGELREAVLVVHGDGGCARSRWCGRGGS